MPKPFNWNLIMAGAGIGRNKILEWVSHKANGLDCIQIHSCPQRQKMARGQESRTVLN